MSIVFHLQIFKVFTKDLVVKDGIHRHPLCCLPENNQDLVLVLSISCTTNGLLSNANERGKILFIEFSER